MGRVAAANCSERETKQGCSCRHYRPKIHEANRHSNGDSDPRWAEEEKRTGLTQPGSGSGSESGGPVRLAVVDGRGFQHRLSAKVMEANKEGEKVCNPATDGQAQPADVLRKCRRRQRKEDGSHEASAGEQREACTAASVLTRLGNHTDDNVTNTAGVPFTTEVPGPPPAADAPVDDHVPAGRRRRRLAGGASTNAALYANANDVSKREQRAGEQTEKSGHHTKRRGPEADVEQVSSKLLRWDGPQETAPSSPDTDPRGRESHRSPDEQERISAGKTEGPSLHSQQQDSGPLAHPGSEARAPPSEAPPPLDSPGSRHEDVEQSAEANCGEEAPAQDATNAPEKTSSGRPSAPAPFPRVKAENVEMEVDRARLGSNPAESVEPSAGGIYAQGRFCRRKKGAKRRRRMSNVLMPTVEEKETAGDGGRRPDAGGDASADKLNAIYTKKGGKTVLKCGFCGLIVKFMSQFIIHQRIHTGERPFKCDECGKGFSKNSNLNLHLKTHRKSHAQEDCSICRVAIPVAEYPSHMKLHAPEQEGGRRERRGGGGGEGQTSPEERESKVCQYCGKTFRFPSALIRHVRVHTGEKPYKCDICGKAFGQAYFLRVHELTHWSVKRYNCTRCGKSFSHYSNAKNHTCRPPESSEGGLGGEGGPAARPSLTYTCHICKSVFESLQEFNGHMREHAGAKLYRCLYCDKLFGLLAEFSSHCGRCQGARAAPGSAAEGKMSLLQYAAPARRPSSAPPLKVTECGTREKGPRGKRPAARRLADLRKPFQSTIIPAHPLSRLVSRLNQLDDRSDPRKYLCPGCGRLFRHMGRLRAHMLTHAPGQSYSCACCGKTLESWRKLWHHQRVHRQRRGRFTCPECGRGFRFVEPYRKHMSEHPDFRWVQLRPRKARLPYQCEQCRCGFRTLDLLFSHQLCHSSVHEVHRDHILDLTAEEAQSDRKTAAAVAAHARPQKPSPALSPPPLPTGPVLRQSRRTSQNSSVLNRGSDAGKTPRRSAQNAGVEETPGRRPVPPAHHHASNSSPSGGVNCAVCGHIYADISGLYHHYLQHARGQV